MTGLACVVAAGFCWGTGNNVVKGAAREGGAIEMFPFIAWSSLFAIPPLLALTVAFEGPDAIATAISEARWDAWTAVAWQVVGNTLFGFAVWGWLLARYDATIVSPYALLVPVFGMGASAWLLGESLPEWKLAGGALVLTGIAITTLVRR
jgi:O-acetylserine/cysteine efflux transporter